MLGGPEEEGSLARVGGKEAVTRRKMCSAVAWPVTSRGPHWHSASRVRWRPIPSPTHPWRGSPPSLGPDPDLVPPTSPSKPQSQDAAHKMLAGATRPCPWRREGSDHAELPQKGS